MCLMRKREGRKERGKEREMRNAVTCLDFCEICDIFVTFLNFWSHFGQSFVSCCHIFVTFWQQNPFSNQPAGRMGKLRIHKSGKFFFKKKILGLLTSHVPSWPHGEPAHPKMRQSRPHAWLCSLT